MKNLIYGVSLLTIIGVAIVGCEKKVLPSSPSAPTSLQYDSKSQINYSDIETKDKGFLGSKGSSKILKFKNLETFTQTLDELERQVNELDSAFVLKYEKLNEEEINDKVAEIGFNENQPIIAFNNKTNFNSLYEFLAIETDIFLNQDEPNWDNDPDDHFIVGNALRSMLNTDAEVIIGQSIYQFREDGTYIEITDGDLKTLNNIDKINIFKISNILVHNADNLVKSSRCKTNKTNKNSISRNGYRLKWKIRMYNYPWGCGMVASTTSLKKKRRGWARYRTYIYAAVNGRSCDNNGTLSNLYGWHPQSHPNKSYILRRITGVCQTKTGQVFGAHVANGMTYYSTLTFW